MERPPNSQTARDVLRAVVGAAINPRWASLDDEQQAEILAPHESLLRHGERALDILLQEAASRGVAAAHAKLRGADAFDPEAVDNIMEAVTNATGDEAPPLDVPRRPWPGGL